MPKIVTDLEKQRVKDVMFDSVISLLKEKNIKKITVDDIVKMTGISKGSFYLYYKSREELMYNVLKHCESKMFNSLLQLSNDACEKHEKIKKALYEIYLSKDSIVLYVTQSEHQSLLRKLPSEVYEKEKQKSTNYFEEAMAFFDIDPKRIELNVLSQLMDALVFVANNHGNHYAEGRQAALQIIVNTIADYIIS